jgi:hypothetical protein
LGINAANRLTLICLNLPNIKFYAQDLLGRDKTSANVAEMMNLIRTAKNIDSELEHWALTLPKFWEPCTKKVVHEVPNDEEIRTAEFWLGPVQTYGDLSMANIWNDYRVSRIFCQAVILGCVAALPSEDRRDHTERISEQAVHVTQKMVDDFCSAIPYLLGFDFKSRNQSASEETGKLKDYYYPGFLFIKEVIC